MHSSNAPGSLFSARNVPSNKHDFRAIEFKWLQFPAARHEIEKLRAIGEADETLRANHARRQAIRKAFETIARENFAGSECERFEFRLMLCVVAGIGDPGSAGAIFLSRPIPNNSSGSILQRSVRTIAAVGLIFPQFRFKRLDLSRLDEIDLVQQQDVCAFDLQTGCVAQFRETNKHVRVDD